MSDYIKGRNFKLPKVLLHQKSVVCNRKHWTPCLLCLNNVPPLPLVVRGLFKMVLGDMRGTVNDSILANWTKGLWRMRGAVNSLVSPLKWLFVLVAFLFSSSPFTTFPSLSPCETRQLHFLLKCLTGSHLAFKVSRLII